MADFDKAVISVIFREGGYVDHPNDRGGATKYGVTQGTLDHYRDNYNIAFPHKVGQLKTFEAKEIYQKLYWEPIRGSEISSQELCEILLDQAINCGVKVAVRRMQQAVNYSTRNILKVDGIIGPTSLRVLNYKITPRKVATEFVLLTQLYYAKIVRERPSQASFIVGWVKRTHKLLELAINANR